MLRLSGNRIHGEYVDGTLDALTRETVDKAIADLSRLDAEIAHHRSARVVATSVGRLADALDADDHVTGQQEVAAGGSMMAAMAILSGWEVGGSTFKFRSAFPGGRGPAPRPHHPTEAAHLLLDRRSMRPARSPGQPGARLCLLARVDGRSSGLRTLRLDP